MDVETDIESLSKHIFLEDSDDRIAINLPELEATKDLAFFFVDLFRHGMVLLYGENDKVDIEKISITEFDLVKRKMNRIGITINLDIEPFDPEYENISVTMMQDGLPLKEYVFTLHKQNRIYRIYFEYI